MISLLAALIINAEPAAGSAKSCQADVVSQIIRDDDNGAPYVILTASGRKLRISGEDFIDPRTWRKGDAISICLDDKDSTLAEVTNTRREEQLMTWVDASPR